MRKIKLCGESAGIGVGVTVANSNAQGILCESVAASSC